MDAHKMLADARTEHATLTDRIVAVQKLIKVLEEMISGAPGDENSMVYVTAVEYPKPRDAVLEAISSRPGVAFEPKDITAMIRDAGKFNPGLKSGPTAYTTALARLAEESGSKVMRQGERYVYIAVADVAQWRRGEEFPTP